MMDTGSFMQHFHFLRPWFLLALPLGLGFFYTLRHSYSGQSSWKSVIDPGLLTHLIDHPENTTSKNWHIHALVAAWIIACLAMAGPAWKRVPQIAEKSQDALIIILDLSLSMYAEDQKPSRIIHARRKLADILTARKDGLTALVVYSGDAHIVTPLTTDTDTITTLVPVLEPGMMPKIGTNLGAAIHETENILKKSGHKKADVFLLTDEITSTQFPLLETLAQKNLHLSILTFGTSTGAPIPFNNSFLKSDAGDMILARLNWDDIQDFASANQLLALKSGFDDSDIRQLLDNLSISEQTRVTERTFDIWQDAGHWLTLLLIPIMLVNFRRGWILLALLVILPDNSYAMSWNDLWHTKDQQAAEVFQQGDTQTAAKIFENPQWKAAAEYKNGNYETALEGFKQDTSAEGFYNKGNALAKSGQLDKAIKSYDEALKKQPDFADATFNRELVSELLKQQKQEQEQQKQQKDQDSEQQDQDKTAQDQDKTAQNQDQQQQDSGKPQDGTQQGQDKPQQGDQGEQNKPSDTSAGQQNNQQQQDSDTAKNSSAEKKHHEEDKNAAMQQSQKTDSAENNDKTPAPGNPELTPLEKEQRQALQQWLRKIPDDPGQLLRNKFRYQYENNRNQNEHIDKDSEQLW